MLYSNLVPSPLAEQGTPDGRSILGMPVACRQSGKVPLIEVSWGASVRMKKMSRAYPLHGTFLGLGFDFGSRSSEKHVRGCRIRDGEFRIRASGGNCPKQGVRRGSLPDRYRQGLAGLDLDVDGVGISWNAGKLRGAWRRCRGLGGRGRTRRCRRARGSWSRPTCRSGRPGGRR